MKTNNKIYDDLFDKRTPGVPVGRVSRSPWDQCSIKLYARQYYQGNEIRLNRRKRLNGFRAKSIKTFGKCCWRVFR